MTIDEFEKQYDPDKKCYGLYRHKHYGDTISGRILSEILTSKAGVKFTYVGSFSNTVKIENIKSIEVFEQ